jgi:hypothetical protein
VALEKPPARFPGVPSQGWAAALLAASVVLAGCAARSGGSAAAADPTLGTLRGVVVDAAVRPLAGAAVAVQPGGLNATTGADGLFAFPGLRPGDYSVTVAKDGYIGAATTATVAAGEGPALQVLLEVALGSARYANLYKFDGLYECSAWPTNGCANVNILTGVVFCSLDLPCFNTTGDRSIQLIPIDGIPDYLQSEMTWEPTLDTSRNLLFGVGGATRQELQDGLAEGYNFTEGPSPLTLGLDHTLLVEKDITGASGRMLLLQISSAPTYGVPGGCAPVSDTCGAGASFEQPFTVYTHAFFGYVPPPDWTFVGEGDAPPPP